MVGRSNLLTPIAAQMICCCTLQLTARRCALCLLGNAAYRRSELKRWHLLDPLESSILLRSRSRSDWDA